MLTSNILMKCAEKKGGVDVIRKLQELTRLINVGPLNELGRREEIAVEYATFLGLRTTVDELEWADREVGMFDSAIEIIISREEDDGEHGEE